MGWVSQAETWKILKVNILTRELADIVFFSSRIVEDRCVMEGLSNSAVPEPLRHSHTPTAVTDHPREKQHVVLT